MNVSALKRFRATLAASQPAYGLWVTLEAPSITEMGVALGLDWIVIDAEHGHLDWKEIGEHLRAAVRSETVVLVRIAELNGSLIKRALDIGADGVVVPWMETAEQLREAVALSRYPPAGRRGIGAERATAWGHALEEHTRVANEQVIIVPIIETVRAIENVPQLAAVDGVDVFFFGPADLSASAGHRGQWEGPGVAEQILAAKNHLRSAGKHCGIMATGVEDMIQRREQDFRMIGVGSDAGLLLRSLKAGLAAVERDRTLHADLTPGRLVKIPSPIERLPDELRPDQRKVARGPGTFKLGLTADFFSADGQPRYRDMGLDIAGREPAIEIHRLENDETEIAPERLAGLHGVVVLAPRVTAQSLSQADSLLAIGRFGVGYDSVDVAACTARDVLLYITAGAVDRPVAEATVAWMLALAHHVQSKDRLVREARWQERSSYMGTELRDRTLGVIGFGGIGRAVVQLLAGFGMRPPLVFDPHVEPALVARLGARAVSLDELLTEADFVSLHCPLNEQTRNLITARELAMMKSTAYFINTARGGIVDEQGLYAALAERQIAGAAIDCFVGEPLTTAPKFATLDNVLLAPHAIAWTEELFRDIGRMAFRGMVELLHGRQPAGVVNPDVLDRPGFQEKWRRIVEHVASPLPAKL